MSGALTVDNEHDGPAKKNRKTMVTEHKPANNDGAKCQEKLDIRFLHGGLPQCAHLFRSRIG